MLGALRKHSKSFLIYLMFGMIIVVFIFTFNTGIGRNKGCGSREVPLYSTIDGEELDEDGYLRSLRLLRGFVQNPLAGDDAKPVVADISPVARAAGLIPAELSMLPFDLRDLTPEHAERLLKVIEMIQLAAGVAEDMGLEIEDKDLARAMYPERFRVEKEVDTEDGGKELKKVFDKEEFDRWVTNFLRSSKQDYEASVRQILLTSHLAGLFGALVAEDPMEQELKARAQKTTAGFSYVVFNPEDFKPGAVEETDVARLLETDEERVKDYYDSHPAEFHKEEGWEVSGILVAGKKPPQPEPGEIPMPQPLETPNEEERQQAQKTAQGLLDAVNQNVADRATSDTLVQVRTEEFESRVVFESDFSGKYRDLVHGGFEDFHSLSQLQSKLGADVAAEVIKAQTGEIVGPLQGEMGSWLVLVRGHRDREDRVFDDAKKEIADRLIQNDRSGAAAKAKAEELLKIAAGLEDKDLDKALETLKETHADLEALDGLDVEPGGPFTLASRPTVLGTHGEFEDVFKKVFSMSLDKPLADEVFVQEDTQKVVVLRMTQKEEPSKEDLEAALAPSEEIQELDLQAALLGGGGLSSDYFASWLRGLHAAATEVGTIKRSADFGALIEVLQQRALEREQEAAAKSGAAAPGQ